MSDFDWRVAVRDDMRALATDSRRVHIYRRVGEGTIEAIVGFGEHGDPVVERFDAAVSIEPTGFLIPAEALEAIAELLKPGPSQGETRRLEEALAVERARVDRVFDAHLEGP